MRILIGTSTLMLGLIACQTGGELGGGDPGWELDDAPFAEAPSSDIDDEGMGDALRTDTLSIDSAECIEGEEEVAQALSTTVSGTSVTLLHEGVGTWCEAAWTATADISSDGYIDVFYGDSSGTTSETADCWCHWTVTTTINDLAPGDWSVSALDDTATFTIE